MEGASLLDLRTELDLLDAHEHTMLCIRRGPGRVPHLVIGGGSGSYVVYAAINGAYDLWTLVRTDAPRSEVRIELVAGGQPGLYAKWCVVGKKQALAAAAHFLKTGLLDATQRWRHR